MRCVVQRVAHASVKVGDEWISQIGQGYMVLVGAEDGDTEADARYCADKIAGLRVFEDENDKMNLSVRDVGGSALLGDARHGRRPSFSNAARPEAAEPLCAALQAMLEAAGLKVCTGRFRTHMKVELLNDGPVTILLDSRKTF